MSIKPNMLIILDGVGLSSQEKGNAFIQANTPNIDELLDNSPHARLKCSGLNVGLPEGQMGNSEVGHMSIGAGRVIYQDLTLISKDIAEEKFFSNRALLKAINNVKKNSSALHLMGLVSDGGVHSHIEHLYALLKLCKDNNIDNVYVHAFMDGRDTSPTSGLIFLKELEEKIAEIGVGNIATITGRYYAMDRDNRWDRVELAYNAMLLGEGSKFRTVQKAIEQSYEKEEFDEFILPIVISDENNNAITTINDEDSCVFFNFRPDRAREITKAIINKKFDSFNRKKEVSNIVFITMTEYDETIQNVEVAYRKEEIKNTLGEYLAKNNKTQVRIAETEKYAHVTFFLNGGKEKKYSGENRILVPSPKVATYDEKPEMSAFEITEKVNEAISEERYDCIIVNFANGDMVGHTGNMEKTIKAIEVVDECLGKIINKLKECSGTAIITADHGNCEYMIDTKTGEAVTSHSVNDVPIIIFGVDKIKSLKNGTLTDISPTLLDIMGLEKPKEMTGSSIISW